MAQIWVTGPCAIYVALPAAPGTPVFLGHGEDPPKVREERHLVPVRCDLAGAQAIFDMIYEGRSVDIVIDLIRYNLAVFQQVRAFPNATNTPGIDDWGARGTLLGQEGKATAMWLQFPYSTKAAMAGLPRGLPFEKVLLHGPDEYEPGTRPYKIRSVFKTLPRYDPATGRFITYGTDWPAGIPDFPAE